MFEQYKKALTNKAMQLTFAGRKFKCNDTNTVVMLMPPDCFECSYVRVGRGSIDLGRLNGYIQITGNIQEVKDEQQS